MRIGSLALLVLLALPLSHCLAQQFTCGDMKVGMRGGVIVSLADAKDTVYARATGTDNLCALRTLSGDIPANGASTEAAGQLPATLDFPTPQTPASALQMTLASDAKTGELIVQQSGQAPAGLHGIQWGIAGIPLDYEIIVPGQSGIKIGRNSPVTQFQFSYPMGWECQFVIVQGPAGGFCVRADDPTGQYKNLRVFRRDDGWSLAFESQNPAPFADKTHIASVKWRLGLTGPRWQAAANRYRQWATDNFHLTAIADQQPAWVKDIRALVICGLEQDRLEPLAAVMDPRQTMLYVPEWRRDGYDRNYPDYTALPGLQSFLDKAHALGFRVMLHVNYFGCDPKNPMWSQLQQYQVHDPFSHEPLWWTWPQKGLKPGEEPAIKFAYINPASKAWRELFVGRMKELCTRYPVDALHLDQTLCIWNADGGPVDGLTMLEGSLAEHRELREALPNVALSGEGLNEVTCRYEAFAQRHAWGLNHSEGTWDRAALQMAHPISSSILRPFTIINGYLGETNPGNEQLYAAWQQAYTRWGVIPTFSRPSLEQLKAPQGFGKQLLDEIRFFQSERLDPDPGGAWAADTLFPYRTASGGSASYVADDGWRLISGQRTVIRTVTGVSEVANAGTIPGWLAYDQKSLFGLHQEAWYPLFDEPCDQSVFHLASLPAGLEIARLTCSDDMAVIGTTDPGDTLWASDLIAGGRCGYTVFGGQGQEVAGLLNSAESGASFASHGRDLWLHPPWKATQKNPQTGVLEATGTGDTYCTLQLALPPASRPRFLSQVYMDPGAVGEGKTDGVTFTVEATDGALTRKAELHTAVSEPRELALDLREFAGRKVTLRLRGDPGPKHSATFDWARWASPRVTLQRQLPASLAVVSPRPWTTALASSGAPTLTATGPQTYRLECALPGTVYLLNRPLQDVALPADLTQLSFLRSFVSPSGAPLISPQYAAAAVGGAAVGGVAKQGFSTHPPQQGQTRMDFPLRLPTDPCRLRCYVGLRDGSKSEGCSFIVEVNGQELARRSMLPGKWELLDVDLGAYAGKPVVLSLVTDAEKDYSFDWATWGEPRLEK